MATFENINKKLYSIDKNKLEKLKINHLIKHHMWYRIYKVVTIYSVLS